MKPKINCPVCDGKASLHRVMKKRKYRGETFEVYEHYYKCDKCSHSFTNEQVDNYNIQIVHNKYREKYSIPFPEQLKFIRESYGLSQTKMSEVLGFGPNQYRLYEAGDIPVGGNATVLSMIIDPKEFKNLLSKKQNLFSKIQLDSVFKKIDKTIDGDFSIHLKNILFPRNIIPDSYTGFKLPSFKKFANMVLYFLDEAPFKTRLNKLLFYADFAHFKYYGNSMTGCHYAAIDMGSVPDQYAIIFGLMESEGFLTTESVLIKGNEVDKFVPLMNFDEELFTNSEVYILKIVLEKFKSNSTQEIKLISHNEPGWIENEKTKSIIDYSVYAPQLKAV